MIAIVTEDESTRNIRCSRQAQLVRILLTKESYAKLSHAKFLFFGALNYAGLQAMHEERGVTL
jgi:hypothetical protein